MTKVIIAGSRDFDDYEFLRKNVDKILFTLGLDQITVVSGTAKGADTLGEQYAEEKGYNVVRFPADWDRHGKSAGYIRNEEMAKFSDQLIAFWNLKSKGTKHMIDLARKHNLGVNVVYVNNY